MADFEEDDLDAFLYGDDKEDTVQEVDKTATKGVGSHAEQTHSGKGGEEAAGSEGSSDEEDIEIVMDEGEAAPPESAESRTIQQMKQPTEEEKQADEAKKAIVGNIDINAIGEFDGQWIIDYDLDGQEDKPWRKPGADITDFFNYGFTETTWRAYMFKQRSLRDEYGGHHKPHHRQPADSAINQRSSTTQDLRQSKYGTRESSPQQQDGRESRQHEYRRDKDRDRYDRDRDHHRDKRRRDESADSYGRGAHDRYAPSSRRRY